MFRIEKTDLHKAWREIYREKPKKRRKNSRGVDNVSIEDFKIGDDARIDEIHRQTQDDFFYFNKLKNYKEIKPGKKKARLIQAPTVRDRIVQKVLSNELNRISKEAFSNVGIVGSVKGTTIKKAIGTCIRYYREGYCYVLKTDIQDYFPSISKKRLKKYFYTTVQDKALRSYFEKYLVQSSKPGIPQGPPLSPYMANLYLYGLDKYLTGQKQIRHIRYLDDLVVFCKDKDTAIKTYTVVKRMFVNLHLSIHPLGTEGKTYIDRFDTGKIDVLGIIYKNDQLYIKPKKYKTFLSENITPLKFKTCLNRRDRSLEDSLKDLILDLEHTLNGWIGAYSFCNIDQSMAKLDKILFGNVKSLLSGLVLSAHQREMVLRRLPIPSLILKKTRRGKNNHLALPPSPSYPHPI